MTQQKEYTIEEIDAIADTLPDDVKDAIFSVSSAKIIGEVGKKYGLHIDQIGLLAEETGNILLGISRPTEFVDNLQTKLKIERVRASEVASEVNEKIFYKVRESMHNLRGAEEAGKELSHNAEPESLQNYIPKKEDLLEAIQRPDMYARPMPTKPEVQPLEVEPLVSKPTDLLGQKLSGAVAIPKREAGKASDPYREVV